MNDTNKIKTRFRNNCASNISNDGDPDWNCRKINLNLEKHPK